MTRSPPSVAPPEASRPTWAVESRTGKREEYVGVLLAGRGSFAEVWKARNSATGELLAIKQLLPEWRDHRTARRLLENEADVARQVESPVIVRLVHARPRASVPFLVFEWLEGTTLEEQLQSAGMVPCHRALWIIRQCLSGLLALSLRDYLHGDLKPSNVFVCRTGEVKLIDLGFARPAGSMDSELTGTPEYLAPEVVAGENSGLARDTYSLGLMLYRMLTGRLPFHAETVPELIEQHQRKLAAPIRGIAPHVPREVAAFTERLLSKQPLRRTRGLNQLFREVLALELGALATELRTAQRAPLPVS